MSEDQQEGSEASSAEPEQQPASSSRKPRKRSPARPRVSRPRASKEQPVARSSTVREGENTAKPDEPPKPEPELRHTDGTPMRRTDHGGALLSGHAVGSYGGRPSSYDPEFCAQVEEMGSRGYTLAMMAAEIGVIRDTLREWGLLHPEFSSALTRARENQLAWMEKQGVDGLWEDTKFGRKLNERQWGRMAAKLHPDEWAEEEAAAGKIDWGNLPAELLSRIAAGHSAALLLAGLTPGLPAQIIEAEVVEEGPGTDPTSGA